MARFYPNAQSASVPASEKRVFGALKKLGDDWVVIHGLRFVAPAHGRFPPRNGEADFVLVHPRHGLLVLEVKGGRYEIEHGAWYTFPSGQRTRMDRSPFEQATQNRYDLAEHINRQTGLRGLPFGHAMVFTDGAPHVTQRTERQIQFTAEQLAVIEATAPGSFVSVLGAAGTGKTVIAARRAAELGAGGLRVVFVADQRYLHGSLRNQPALRRCDHRRGTELRR